MRRRSWHTENSECPIPMERRNESRNFTGTGSLERCYVEFPPDVFYIWNMHGIHPSTLVHLQKYRIPVFYYISDYWLARLSEQRGNAWHGAGLVSRILGIIIRHFSLGYACNINLQHTQFTSQFVKQRTLDAGLRCEDGRVIQWSVDLAAFPFAEKRGKHMRLLYVGQLVPHKGVHTAIKALYILKQQNEMELPHLTLVGGTVLPEYEAELRTLVKKFGLDHYITFRGELNRERLPEVYDANDILLFPSIWDEPFSITVLEAMASGLAVVATSTGGSAEILVDGINAMLFEKENADACAAKIRQLIGESLLFEKIVKSARCCVEKNYAMEFMIKQIEDHFESVLTQQKP
jgi:glycogen(starch) synthase